MYWIAWHGNGGSYEAAAAFSPRHSRRIGVGWHSSFPHDGSNDRSLKTIASSGQTHPNLSGTYGISGQPCSASSVGRPPSLSPRILSTWKSRPAPDARSERGGTDCLI